MGRGFAVEEMMFLEIGIVCVGIVVGLYLWVDRFVRLASLSDGAAFVDGILHGVSCDMAEVEPSVVQARAFLRSQRRKLAAHYAANLASGTGQGGLDEVTAQAWASSIRLAELSFGEIATSEALAREGFAP